MATPLRRSTTPSGIIKSIGTGDAGYAGDGGSITGAVLSAPFGVPRTLREHHHRRHR